MTRLGLWGAGTAFNDFAAFHKELDKRGVGALEMLAIEMKSQAALPSLTSFHAVLTSFHAVLTPF